MATQRRGASRRGGVSEIVEFLWCHSVCFGVVFPETFMSTITFGSSIAVWFMKKVSSFIAQCEVLLTLEELAITHHCEKWHPPECLYYKTKSGCRFGEKFSFAHRQVHEQPTERSQKNDEKSAVAMLKKGDWQERGPVTDQCHDRPGKLGEKSVKRVGQNSSKRQSSDARQLGCVFQDMTPLKSILRKCTDMRKPFQRVKFTKAVARRTKIRDQSPLGDVCPGEPHERSPNAPKFEDRSLEETEWQERGARDAAWKLAKSV